MTERERAYEWWAENHGKFIGPLGQIDIRGALEAYGRASAREQMERDAKIADENLLPRDAIRESFERERGTTQEKP